MTGICKIALPLCAALLLSACGGTSPSTVGAATAPAKQPAGDPAIAKLVPKDLTNAKVAVFGDWAPEEYVESGQIKGWSVELAKALSAKMGVAFTYTATGFDMIIPGLDNGRYDVAVASLGVTSERLESLDFVPLQKEGTAFGWKKGSGLNIKAIQDTCGKTVAVLTGAWEYKYLTENNAKTCGSNPMKIQQFKDQPSAELAVTSGRVQLVAAGSGKLKYSAKQTGQLETSDLLVNAVYNGLGVKKDSPLGPALKAALQAVIDDGTYAKIRSGWGVTSQGDLKTAVLITKANPEG
ncbi:transporter substrate-binding domain-containing protein [Nonomuraea sp. NEAU-A123]|uniref:transporter substrate-binding domain-containing protein n=1 Tax=Nonomuraea sp. NEAU-A123 TaxID=2839649 RepID=UPI001BE43DB6|nr:transporter substrate-binding domain-containing protein [Nonomuraea sp. NEAU-A123]MBT2232913.1 transporter substrate-binding domain-containing protein [Nonomuraea sp. NEAU-A123]